MLACLSWAWLGSVLIWLIIVCAAIAIANVLVPWVAAKVGASPDGGVVVQILRIVVWAVLAVYLVLIVIDLLACVFGGGLPRLPR